MRVRGPREGRTVVYIGGLGMAFQIRWAFEQRRGNEPYNYTKNISCNYIKNIINREQQVKRSRFRSLLNELGNSKKAETECWGRE